MVSPWLSYEYTVARGKGKSKEVEEKEREPIKKAASIDAALIIFCWLSRTFRTHRRPCRGPAPMRPKVHAAGVREPAGLAEAHLSACFWPPLWTV